jgi:hypothetical protein
MGTKLKTTFSISTPGYVSGAARLLDLYGQFDEYDSSANDREADARALYSDWSMVGGDIEIAIEECATSDIA